MRHALVAFVAALAAGPHMFAAGQAQAAPITYTETATASGTLGAAAFTDRALTVSFTGDTAGIVSPIPGFVTNVAGVASFNLAGVGTGVFNGGNPAAFDFQSQGGAGIGATSTNPVVDQNGQTFILATNGAQFAAYDLTGAIGPVTGPAVFVAGLAFSTTAGDFTLTAAGPVTFTAVIGAAPVPEPASLMLLGAGLLGLSVARRRRDMT